MSHMKSAGVQPYIGNIEETGCPEPALKKKTNDDDDQLNELGTRNERKYLRN